MASQLTEEQTLEFKSAFASFDRDHDNSISARDLSAALKSLGHNLTDAEIAAWIAEADTEGHGSVSFAAFMQMAGRNFRDVQAEEEMKEAFKVIDTNGDGFIDHAELKASMAAQGDNLTEEEVNEIIRECDVDGDGKLNYDEFAKMMHPPKV
ncbi:hypothetical protein HDU98_005704 [Podochytrium sp. JEL0797]|nr:hypothetical protein HDU98_005704 [Podochytrium sp. JEL0797]